LFSEQKQINPVFVFHNFQDEKEEKLTKKTFFFQNLIDAKAPKLLGNTIGSDPVHFGKLWSIEIVVFTP